MYNYRNWLFSLGLLLYILLFSSYVAFNYFQKKEAIIESIDKELYYAAVNLPLIAPENFHHKNMHQKTYTKEENLKFIKKLSLFVKTTHIKYLYAFIMKDEKILFTLSSATDEELSSGQDLSFYLTPYDEDDGTIFDAFKTQNPSYTYGKDHWGSFRSLALPLVSEDGTHYVVGADIEIDSLDDIFSASLSELLWFIFPIVVLMIIYLLIGIYVHIRLENIISKRTQEIEQFSHVETLTGLPNRKSLTRFLEDNEPRHLAIFNVNRFQVVNDLYGNKVGDLLIVEIARTLGLFIQDSDLILYKLHADEFALLGSSKKRQEEFILLLERIVAQLEENIFIVDEHNLTLTVSVGIASLVNDPLIAANVALKESRRVNKKIYIYEKHLDLAAEVKHNQEVIAEIYSAIENHRIFPYFQPIYDVKQAKVTKYESLMRLERKSGEVVAPYYFLEISHQARIYPKLSMIMLEGVLQKALQHPDKSFSFNLSAVDIENSTSSQEIISMIKASSVAHQLTLEILESEGFSSYEVLAKFISEVKKHGVSVAIDDFGSGYSNFAEIAKLDIDFLKIDGSLVKKVIEDIHYEHIIVAIVKFSKSLKLKTIAEFVENEALAEKLMSLGVDMLQGYYIGKPIATCDS